VRAAHATRRRCIVLTSSPPFLAPRQEYSPGLRFILGFVLTALTTFSVSAQIQQAWVVHYNNGITNGTNQAVKMALDSSGNIYVTGFSQNSLTNLGYVTIKYAPNSKQLWTARYDSTNYPTAAPSALALDLSNDVFITGNALIIKYDPNGNLLWTAPYAGTALAVDTNGDCVVTGISTSFGTVKLNPAGSNLWVGNYPSSYGPGLGEQVLVAKDNGIYVSGYYMFLCYENMCFEDLLVIKYAANGMQLWATQYGVGATHEAQVTSAALDSQNNVYMTANFAGLVPYVTLKYSSNGSLLWSANNPTDNGNGQVLGLVLDESGSALITGENAFSYTFSYGTYKLSSNGGYVWTNLYPTVVVNPSVATSIAVDSADNCYVTGYSPGSNFSNDIVTIKYGPNGNQIWLQRYDGPGNGNDAGNAIAVDSNGNVYVAGYDTTAAGGTEMVLIKYSPVILQRQSNGTVLLQTEGSPGESFEIQASADLLNWLDLGSVLADTNGLMQFFDTNAPNYASRFYITSPQ
jgi:hypothetical protein